MPYLRVTPVAVAENAGYVDVVVTLDQPSAQEVRAGYDTQDGSATRVGGQADYERASGTLVFAPGETTKTVRIAIADDAVAEGREAFWFTLSDAVNATVQRRQTAVTVYDDDDPGDALNGAHMDTQLLVDEQSGQARLVVWTDRPVTARSTLDIVVLAPEGSAEQEAWVSVTFQPGELVQTVDIDLLDDTAEEAATVVRTLLFSEPGSEGYVADPFGMLIIAPNDAPPVATPYIRALPSVTDEAQPLAGFTVLLSAPSDREVHVAFDTLAGSAELGPTGQDVQRHSGVLVFAPGETSRFVPVMLMPDDVAEGDEVFWLELSSPVNGIVEQALTPGLLVDNDNDNDDGPPSIVSISDAVIDEAEGVALFHIQLDKAVSEPMSAFLVFRTVDGTARAGEDYASLEELRFIVPGETVLTVAVQLFDDGLAESDERFELVITETANLTVLDRSATAIISRNDTATASGDPEVSVQPIVVSEADRLAQFTITLDRPSTREVRVTYDLAGDTATAGGPDPDFQGHSGTLVFQPGDTVKTVSAVLLDDGLAEGTETFRISLHSPVNASLGQATATATLLDDDGPPGSGTLWSLGLGNDLYVLTSADDRIAEGPGGGIDTVRSAFSWVLPEHVENLVLVGETATDGTGNAGANVFRGHAGDNRFDGQAGVDTVVFEATRAEATISGDLASRTVASEADGHDTLLDIERLQFADVLLAYDTSPGGRTHAVLALWQAAFDRAPDQAELSRWTAELDAFDGNSRDLGQAIINAYAPGMSDEAVVSHLWSTLFVGAVPDDALRDFTGLMADGTFSQASLFELASMQDVNLAEIAALVGQPVELDPAFFPIPS